MFRIAHGKALLLLAAFGFTLVLLLAACSPDSAAAKGSSATKEAAASAPVDPEADLRLPEGPAQPKPGGTLRISTAANIIGFNPHGLSGPYIPWLGRLFFDNLVYLDAHGAPTPWLAKSWEISPDGLTYTFHLRDDVTFSDGSKFNAEALRINLEHMRDPATRSALAGRYILPYRDGEVVDEYTFRAHLREPFSAFMEVLAQPWLGMLSAKAIKENPNGLIATPVGSGPFVLESFTRQQGLTLGRRKDYHWAPDYIRHQGPAQIERIEVEMIPEEFVRSGSLVSGRHQLTLEVPPQSAASLRANPELALVSRVRQGLGVRPITFNVEQPPFNDVRVRRALALAADREAITQLVGFGEYLPKADYLARNTRAYDPAFRDVLRYDVDAANRLLDEAGWTGRDAEGFRTRDGKRLEAEVINSDSPYFPASVLVALQSDFKRVGFDLRISTMPLAQITERRNAGNYQAIGTAYWQTNTPDGLYVLHHSGEIISPTTFGQNIARLRDPEVDDLLSHARRESTPAGQAALYSAAQKRLLELVPAVPLCEFQNLIAYNRKLHGVLFDTSHNAVFLTGAWLEETP